MARDGTGARDEKTGQYVAQSDPGELLGEGNPADRDTGRTTMMDELMDEFELSDEEARQMDSVDRLAGVPEWPKSSEEAPISKDGRFRKVKTVLDSGHEQPQVRRVYTDRKEAIINSGDYWEENYLWYDEDGKRWRGTWLRNGRAPEKEKDYRRSNYLIAMPG